jgi:general secretion pathway protein G
MLRREKGFTLIELLIVVAIIGIIAAIAVPNLLTAIQRSKRSRTAADVRAIGTALGTYQVDENMFPTDTTSTAADNFGMPAEYYEGATKDAWSTEFVYTSNSNGSEYTLTSYGKDRQVDCCLTNSEFDSDVVFANGQFRAPSALVELRCSLNSLISRGRAKCKYHRVVWFEG